MTLTKMNQKLQFYFFYNIFLFLHSPNYYYQIPFSSPPNINIKASVKLKHDEGINNNTFPFKL